MSYDETRARESLAAIQKLPATLAGENSTAIDAALGTLALYTPLASEFGPLLHEATMAVDTVKSALVTLRDQAREREK